MYKYALYLRSNNSMSVQNLFTLQVGGDVCFVLAALLVLASLPAVVSFF
jgi:hypothetical protein